MPYLERVPRYPLKPMPFKTFGELPALGLALSIYCPSCATRWCCGRSMGAWCRTAGAACASLAAGPATSATSALLVATCTGPIEPMSPDEPFVSMECGGRAAPWFAERAQFGRPPWTLAPIDPAKERYRCPGCGGRVRTTFHGKLEKRRRGASVWPATQRGPSFSQVLFREGDRHWAKEVGT